MFSKTMFYITLYMTVLVLLTVSFDGVNGQDCFTPGTECDGTEQCCGGCCKNGACVETYQSCLLTLDPCKDHTCIGEQNCVIFSPPDCPGCEPTASCQ